jgi:hypothetical protein
VLIAAVTFACVFAGALLGLHLRERLPEHHLRKESEDTVKLVAGLLATLSALVLGLMIASAKGSFDEVNVGLQKSLARVILIDRLLAEYGPEVGGLRRTLKSQTRAQFDRLLRRRPALGELPADVAPPATAGSFEAGLQALAPADEPRRALLARIRTLSDDVRQTHWVVVERADDSLPPVFLVVIVSWLTMMFLSFGLFSPRNWTTVTAMALAALAVATAILLTEEMYRPLDGLIAIPEGPIRAALDLLGR